MDPVLFVRQAAHFQSMELERAEAICGFESSYDDMDCGSASGVGRMRRRERR